jgi:trehalose 6-phosphate synthase
MWDVPRAPIIDKTTWDAWENGYLAVNKQFAEAIVSHVRSLKDAPLVMLQDYHLYLVARMVRSRMRPKERPTIMHFIHIPWPGPEYWGILLRVIPAQSRGKFQAQSSVVPESCHTCS